jgi:NAD(P)-dependent dehydrogenase (short-subunit alcohol dehydrogenase family)
MRQGLRSLPRGRGLRGAGAAGGVAQRTHTEEGLAAGAAARQAATRRAGVRVASLGWRAMVIEGNGALVVGGASGLGEATARRLHSQGAAVTIADVNAEKGQALADELGAAFAACDVREEEQVEAAVQAAAEADAALRICVNCAGTGFAQKIASSRGPHALEPFAVVIAINLIGTFNVLRFAADAMLANEPLEDGERGVCINTASIAAYDGQMGQVAYSASKGGVVGMTLPAARDLAAAGIRVCSIAPGLFDTPLLAALPAEARESLGKSIPFPPRLGQPSEYAALAAHIVENRMLNGEVIRLDGALRMAPR